jgi:phenylacetate-CoA ligase
MYHLIPPFRDTLLKTRRLPPERMKAYQRGLLERLLRHARAEVPFYRDTGRLAPLFRADDTIDWDRWGEIQPLTRREVQAAGTALHAEHLTPEHGPTRLLSTSGSTGEPVSVLVTELAARVVWCAQFLRDCAVNQIDLTARLAYFKPFPRKGFDFTTPERREGWYRGLEAAGIKAERFDVADTRPVHELIAHLLAIRPRYLRALPNTLELICAYDQEQRLCDLGIEALFSVSEPFSPEAQAVVTNHLQCRIIDVYASNEAGRMASTCPQCGRYHLEQDVAFVETVDTSGEVARPGDTGWLLVTPLYNYAMPLIRYDHVDSAIVGEPGGCDNQLPTLTRIFGKERTPFQFPGGLKLRPTLATRDVVTLLGARAYQVAQVADDRCEFRFVPDRLNREEMRLDEMTALMRHLWWPGLKVDYRMVEDIPRKGERGKVVLFVDERSSSAPA